MNKAKSRGLLLIEAILSAIVIAVGLVYISRGLGSHLNTVQRIQERQVMLALASGKLRQLEAEMMQQGRALILEGQFEGQGEGFEWQLDKEDRPDPVTGTPLISDVTLTVKRIEGPSAALKLKAIWPTSWIGTP